MGVVLLYLGIKVQDHDVDIRLLFERGKTMADKIDAIHRAIVEEPVVANGVKPSKATKVKK